MVGSFPCRYTVVTRSLWDGYDCRRRLYVMTPGQRPRVRLTRDDWLVGLLWCAVIPLELLFQLRQVFPFPLLSPPSEKKPRSTESLHYLWFFEILVNTQTSMSLWSVIHRIFLKRTMRLFSVYAILVDFCWFLQILQGKLLKRIL